MNERSEVGGQVRANAEPLAGISVGPGLFLVELNGYVRRFEEAGWTRAEVLALLEGMGLRFLMGPAGRVYVLKAALEVGFALLMGSGGREQSYVTPHLCEPGGEEARGVLERLMAWRRQEFAPTGPAARESLEAGLAHLADCVRRGSEDRTGVLVAEIQEGWKRAGVVGDGGDPPPQ